jgi:hypothetical protein
MSTILAETTELSLMEKEVYMNLVLKLAEENLTRMRNAEKASIRVLPRQELVSGIQTAFINALNNATNLS